MAAPTGGRRDDAPVVTLLAFPLQESGGIAAFVRSLLAALEAAHGKRFPLLAPTPAEAGTGARRGQLRVAARLFRALLKARPRAIQNHENLPLLAAALLGKLLSPGRVRVVHTVHVDPAERKSWLKRALIGAMFALCDRVVVVSEDTRRRLGNLALPLRRNVEVIYGAPPPAAAPSAGALAGFAAAHGLGPGPVICQITRFYYPLKVQGADRLLAAFRAVRRAVPGAQLLLVGSGPLWAGFRDRHGLAAPADGVILTGFTEDPLLPMTLADVYCHVSFQDALPIVVLEAMALGKPVVASPVGGIPELVEDGVSGVLAGPTEAALADDIIRLLRAPAERQALGRQAAARIARDFGWPRCAGHYAALYGVAPALAATPHGTEWGPQPAPASVRRGGHCAGAGPATGCQE
jgi:glycosyltransferase involved in cell wall biosynthesis